MSQARYGITILADQLPPGSDGYGEIPTKDVESVWVTSSPAREGTTGWSILPWVRVGGEWVPQTNQAYAVTIDTSPGDLAQQQKLSTDIREITISGDCAYIQATGITGGELHLVVTTHACLGVLNEPFEGSARLDFSQETNSQYFLLGFP